MKRIIIVIFIIIILSGLSIGESMAQNGWETYRDLQNRFKFSYPTAFGTPRKDNRMDMPDGDTGETIFFPNFSYGLRNGKQVLDKMRNLKPNVISCKVSGNIVIFHKKIVAKFGQFSNPQHIYGAISFRKGVFSSVQFIRITTDPPNDKLLDTMAEVVSSFEELI